MRGQPTWTSERLAQLRTLWESDLTNAQIAEQIGVTGNAVTNALRRHGMRYRPEVWSPERIERFKQLWADESLTTYQIAEAIGLDHHASVSNRAASLGLPARCEHKPWTEADNAQLKQLWAQGYRSKQIAQTIGRTPMSVSMQATKLNLPRRMQTRTEWTPERDERFKQLWMAEPQLSPEQIALQLGCTKQAVLCRRPLLGLSPRQSQRNERVSLAAWDAMSEAQRRALPAFRLPVHRAFKIKRKSKRWGSATF